MTMGTSSSCTIVLLVFTFVSAVIGLATAAQVKELLSRNSTDELDSCVDDEAILHHFNTSNPCNPSHGILAGIDNRRDFSQQCRAMCQDLSDPNFKTFRVESKCYYCRRNDKYQERVYASESGEKNIQICVPRGVCVAECGEEPRGCVYSGTCASLICVESNSGKRARAQRVTHSGPRSIFEVDGKKSAAIDRAVPPGNLYTGSRCRKDGVNFVMGLADKFCTTESKGPLSDSRHNGDNGMCRSYCGRFSAGEYEVVIKRRVCSFCRLPDGSQYSTLDGSTGHVCIPRSVCISECGKEPPGCIYSGSCNELFCFSGIDSKLPAKISTDPSKDYISLSVDNDASPTAIDPPVYANDTNADGPDDDDRPSPSATPQPTKSGVSPAPTADELSEEEGGDVERWAWLGPVLGLVGAALVSIGGIYAAFVLRGSGQTTTDSAAADMVDNIN